MINLKQIAPKIWHLHFEKAYDLSLHLFRFQEFFESPKVMGKKNINFVDLVEWYSKNNNGVFTYAGDWAGYNIPGKQILDLADYGIKDRNRYDDIMIGFAQYIKAKENGDEDFYIIGTSEEDECLNETFRHELAHGLFFSNKEYREKTTKMVNEIPTRTRNFLFKKLKECGYCDNVLIDEAQAYLSTGLYKTFNTKSVKKHMPKFKRVFKKYSSDVI